MTEDTQSNVMTEDTQSNVMTEDTQSNVWCIIDTCPQEIPNDSIDAGLSSVHIVGDRTASGTFFCARDIANLVGVSVPKTVYKNVPQENRVKIKIKKTYIVYIDTFGLLVYLLSTKRGQNTKYAKWAMDIVSAYTTNDCERIAELSAPSLQASIGGKHVATPFPGGIYVLYADVVKNLKSACESLPRNIGDADRVYKYGRSDNLHRRLGEHDIGFPRAELAFVVYMKPEFIGEAESTISAIVNQHAAATKFPFRKQRELFSVSPSMADSLIQQLFAECRVFSTKSGGDDNTNTSERDQLKHELVTLKLEGKDRTIEQLQNENLQLRNELTGVRGELTEVRQKLDDECSEHKLAHRRLYELALLAPSAKRVKTSSIFTLKNTKGV